MSVRIRRRGAFAAAIALAAGVFLTPAAGVLLTPTTASGAASCSKPHCYGVGTWSVHTIYGIYETLNVICIYDPNYTKDFVTAEMWLNTNNKPGGNWVETGMADGYPTLDPYQYMYWADQNTHGYHEHDGATANLNANYSDEISWVGNNSWDVYDNGLVGTSTSNPGPSTREDWGSETNDSSSGVRVNAFGSSLEYEDTHSVWHSGIGIGGVGNPGYINSPPGQLSSLFAPSSLPYSSLQSFDINGQCGTSSARPQTTTAISTPLAAATIAKTIAATNNVPSPGSVDVVQATREVAMAVVDPTDTVTTNEPSYVVQMSGDFIGYGAKVPPGAALPTGTNMTVVINASSGRVTDWSIDNSPHPLSALGPVTQVAS
jgi:hypothetical protein